MKYVIKGQVAILIAMLTAFAVTLSACGGGSSSAGGGSAIRTASVSGTVTNNGAASLDIRGPSALFAAVSDIFIPVAHGAVEYFVEVNCPSNNYSDWTINHKFEFNVEVSGTEDCEIIVDSSSAGIVEVVEGHETEVNVDVSGGSLVLTSEYKGLESGTELEIKVGDDQSSDDIASADDDSDTESVDDESEDDDSNSEDDDSNSEDDDSNSEDTV